MKKVRVIKKFESKRIMGELEYFPYQWAFGISIRYLECDGMGWMFRFYFGPFKIWFNLEPIIKSSKGKVSQAKQRRK